MSFTYVYFQNDSGFISTASLRHIMSSLGEKVTDKEFDDIIQKCGRNEDGQINYIGKYFFSNYTPLLFKAKLLHFRYLKIN